MRFSYTCPSIGAVRVEERFLLRKTSRAYKVRILVDCEETHRTYGDAIVSVIQSAYPTFEVMAVAGQGDLQAQLARFDPHLLISISHARPPRQPRG
jgi:hypothetical protein